MAIFKANVKYSGKVSVGPSKSHIIRLLFCALLKGENTIIEYSGALPGDVDSMISAISQIGAGVTVTPEKIIVNSGTNLNKSAEINIGECGTGYAFFSVLNCFPDWNLKITREGSLLRRDYSNARVDFDAKGNIIVQGSKSSQPVSAAIMCAALLENKKREVFVTGNICSRGYIEMTSRVVSLFEKDGDITVKAETDGSSAGVLLAANYLGANIEINGLSGAKLQPDFCISKYFDASEIDISDNPDLIFTLAVLGAARKGKTVIKNVERLKNKESDRAKGCVDFLTDLGGNAKLMDNAIEIYGTGRLKGGKIFADNDHRMVFGAFLASLISDGNIECVGAEEAIKKSWPDFLKIVKALEEKDA